MALANLAGSLALSSDFDFGDFRLTATAAATAAPTAAHATTPTTDTRTGATPAPASTPPFHSAAALSAAAAAAAATAASPSTPARARPPSPCTTPPPPLHGCDRYTSAPGAGEAHLFRTPTRRALPSPRTPSQQPQPQPQPFGYHHHRGRQFEQQQPSSSPPASFSSCSSLLRRPMSNLFITPTKPRPAAATPAPTTPTTMTATAKTTATTTTTAPSTPTSYPAAVVALPPQLAAGAAASVPPDGTPHRVNFTSHVRALLRQNPPDSTGDLVRLLDDIAMAIRTISAHVASTHLSYPPSCPTTTTTSSSSVASTPQKDPPTTPSAPTSSSSSHCRRHRRHPSPTATAVTRKLYDAVVHDGHICLLLDTQFDRPLAFPPDAIFGDYVMAVTSLDREHHPAERASGADKDSDEDDEDDEGEEEVGEEEEEVDDLSFMAATVFSLYRRRSNCSTPGAPLDLEQCLGDQVAAGYAVYSANTRLCHTLGGAAAHRYSLHPVAAQFFLDDHHPSPPAPAATSARGGDACSSGDDGGDDGSADNVVNVYVDYSAAQRRRLCPVAAAVRNIVKTRRCRVSSDGCATSDFDAAMRTGAVAVLFDLHLLGHAAALARVAEHMGAVALTGTGSRLLDIRSSAKDMNRKETLVAGPADLVALITGVARESEPLA